MSNSDWNEIFWEEVHEQIHTIPTRLKVDNTILNRKIRVGILKIVSEPV